MLEYKGFRIKPIETSPGRWRAKITCANGNKIKTFPDGAEYESIDTGGMEFFSAEEAIEAAKQLIDGGGMACD